MINKDIIDITNKLQGDNIKYINDTKSKKLFSLDTPFMFNGLIIGICNSGNANLNIGYRSYDISTNTILLILPKQIIRSNHTSENINIIAYLLPEELLQKIYLKKDFDLIHKIYDNPCFSVSQTCYDDIISIHTILQRYFNSNNVTFRNEIINNLTKSLIVRIASEYTDIVKAYIPCYNTNEFRAEELTYKFFRLISQECTQIKEVSYYANKLCVTPKYLTSTISKITGKPASSWINQTLLIDVKQKLKNTCLQISEISEMANFSDPSAFTRFFKKHTGTTPFEFRKSNN